MVQEIIGIKKIPRNLSIRGSVSAGMSVLFYSKTNIYQRFLQAVSGGQLSPVYPVFGVWCSLFVVCCFVFVVCCSLFVVCCLLFVVCCLLFACPVKCDEGAYFIGVVLCLLFCVPRGGISLRSICCLLFVVFCLTD
jgi:hypothetical protein